MNNQDMPAGPNSPDSIPSELYKSVPINWPQGLSKLEYAAIQIMASIVGRDFGGAVDKQYRAKMAVEQSKALFAELEKDND